MTNQNPMREGFEQQRKAGMNVDWFTWQIAWHDALFTQCDIPPSASIADTAGAKATDMQKDLWSLVQEARQWEAAYRDSGTLYESLDSYKSAVELSIRHIVNRYAAPPAPSVADAAGASATMEFMPVGSNEHMVVRGMPEVIDALKERLTHDYRLAAGASEGQAKPVAWRVDDSNPALCAIVEAAWEKHKGSRSTFFYLDFAEEVLNAAPIAPSADTSSEALTVWYGSMPESNGKTNWTAILHRGDISEGITIDRSEYPDRVRYEADRMRWMIGELDKEPWILDYDADKHSGYVAPSADSRDAERQACHKCGLPISVNPHPEAGKPPHYLEVGCPKECIPCLSKSRHSWAQRAMKDARDAERYRWLRDHFEDVYACDADGESLVQVKAFGLVGESADTLNTAIDRAIAAQRCADGKEKQG
ncbi:hypothetical protein [Caballeronia sp. AZ7_KS35]|uniref:hypothetical protein n=1 Tax=Caballeronia sp. AZ7_KS35 TaxID=2921762 RepID=UPI0020285CA6|nr:hypothetical protein [Caballeronia sp. AZ7_KS35]